jgi:hypothetical protein
MQSHFLLLLIFALIVSTVFAALQKETLAAQVRFGLLAFGAFVLSTIVLGWLMSPFPS